MTPTFRIHWSMATAIRISAPIAKFCQYGSTPARLRPMRNTVTMRAPTSVPNSRPRPPNRLVPPITTAVIVSRLMSAAALLLADSERPSWTHAPIAYTSPATM